MNTFDNHLNNISVLAGTANPTSHYRYLVTPADITQAYMESHKDLNYALRKEVKRDRFVANASGLQKHITETVAIILNGMTDEFGSLVAEDSVSKVADGLRDIGCEVHYKKPSKKNRINEIASMIGKAIGTSIVKLFDEALKNE